MTTTNDPIQTAISAMQGARKAFGAPGDHVYGAPQGKALFALYKSMADLKAHADQLAAMSAKIDKLQAQLRKMTRGRDHWRAAAESAESSADAIVQSADIIPDWTEAARHMLETWDHWFSGSPGGRAKKVDADRLARAGCFAAQAYCDAMTSIGADGAPGVLMRTFLLALIDPMNPDLDHLRADPAAVAAWRARQEQP